MNSNFFDSLKRRMPHFFNGVDILEYVPHDKSKSIKHLFSNSRYIVLDPERTQLSDIKDNSFNVVASVDRFQSTPNYLNEFRTIHRVSSKFVTFSCSTAGMKPATSSYYKNLTESDFYNNLDLENMFESYKFEIDYSSTTMYFWGVKKISHSDMDKV